MATYQITGPDGKKYRVTGDSPQGAAAALKKHLGSSTPDPRNNMSGKVDATLRGALDAATFGFSDEIAAGLETGFGFLGNYDKAVQGHRDIAASDTENRFGYRLGGQIAGGVGAGLAAAPATVSARLAGSSLGPRVLAGMADGAAAGGLYGVGSGEGVGGRMQEGAVNAGIGALAGGAFPVVAAGAGRGYQAFQNARNANPIARQAGAQPETLRLLGNVIDADGSLGPRGQSNMMAAGREAMLADAGPTARSVLDTAIQRGGQGATLARDRIGGRVGRDAQALTGTLNRTLGTPQGVGTSQNMIRDAAAPQVRQAYQRAYSTPIDYASDAGRQVEDVIRRIPSRLAQTAIRSANELMEYDGLPRQVMAQVADDGSITYREMPSVVQADYIKRALNSIVTDGTDPVTGRMNSDAAFASRIARDLRDAVAEAAPAYREALETAADPLSEQAAVRLGSRLGTMTRDEVDIAVRGMSRPERQAALQGFRSRLDDQMARVTRAVSDGDMEAREAIRGLREMSSRQARTNIRAVMDDPAQADALFDEIDRITRSFELRASVADNSKTYARQATDRRVQDMTAPGVIGTAAQGRPMNATQRIIQALTGQTDDAMRGRQDEVYSEIADLLTRQGGAGQNVYDAVTQIGQTDQATQVMTDRIVQALSAQRLAYPSTVLLGNTQGNR